jgi:hypothetical protein
VAPYTLNDTYFAGGDSSDMSPRKIVYENTPIPSGAINEHTPVYDTYDRIVYENQPSPHALIGHYTTVRAKQPEIGEFESEPAEPRANARYEPENTESRLLIRQSASPELPPPPPQEQQHQPADEDLPVPLHHRRGAVVKHIVRTTQCAHLFDSTVGSRAYNCSARA